MDPLLEANGTFALKLLKILGVFFVKLFLPVSFEVDGIHQDQQSVWIHCTWNQQLCNFIWKEKLKSQLAKKVGWCMQRGHLLEWPRTHLRDFTVP